MTTTLTTPDFQVADINLAPLGRKRIEMAEHEMPGLLSIRAKYAPSKPLLGVRVAGSILHKQPDHEPHAMRRTKTNQVPYRARDLVL